MQDTMQWSVNGKSFEDGSDFDTDWKLIYESGEWHWQYDTHDLTFKIYEHDGEFWKLYHVRYVSDGDNKYSFGFGGQACRMTKVRYLKCTKSPHSSRLMDKGEEEWVRTYEVNSAIHSVLLTGAHDWQIRQLSDEETHVTD